MGNATGNPDQCHGVISVNGTQGEVQIGVRNYLCTGESITKSNADVVYDENTGAYEVTATKNTGDFQQVVIKSVVRDISSIAKSTLPLIFSFDDFSCTNSNVRCLAFVNFSKVKGSSYTGDSVGDSAIYMEPGEKGGKSKPVTWVRGDRTDSLDANLVLRIDQGMNAPVGTKLTIRGLRLSIGTVSLDWTPAPEDVLTRLASLEKKVGITYDPPQIEGPEIMDSTGGGVISLSRYTSVKEVAA